MERLRNCTSSRAGFDKLGTLLSRFTQRMYVFHFLVLFVVCMTSPSNGPVTDLGPVAQPHRTVSRLRVGPR
jgi:hypothetical protein